MGGRARLLNCSCKSQAFLFCLKLGLFRLSSSQGIAVTKKSSESKVGRFFTPSSSNEDILKNPSKKKVKSRKKKVIIGWNTELSLYEQIREDSIRDQKALLKQLGFSVEAEIVQPKSSQRTHKAQLTVSRRSERLKKC